ncbi:MAG: tetratricopeptide repeat protein, partial [Acidobacteriota bacterium]|nr:tetratricopeptide repeat protein [Acidobacteriota bacterium]
IASDLRAGQIDQAKQLLSEALKSSPRDARLWTFNGLALARSGDQPGALASYQRALEFAPDYFPALEGAAEIEYNQHSPRAASLLRRIVKLQPDDQTAHDMLAALAFEQGDCTGGENELRAVRPEDAIDLNGMRELGACLVRQKRLIDACLCLKSCLQSSRATQLHGAISR